MSGLRLALVGPDQQENLAIGYLAAAVEATGHDVDHIPFNGSADMNQCLDVLIDEDPDVVGLSISFQYHVVDALGLATQLRRRGFTGHITCGGHVPTHCWREILRDAPAFDSVIRHEGEDALVELMGRLLHGESLSGLHGVVWRNGGDIVCEPTRTLAADLASLGRPRHRDPPLRVAGVPIAFIITSRGCIGDCAYCSIRAFSRGAGGPPLRLAPPEHVADEIAQLFHDQQVPIFFVQDDLFILPDEAQTLDRIGHLRSALVEREVEGEIFWIKGRPDSITPAVLEAARDLGAIHLFLGVESGSADRLRYLGRRHGPDDNRRALDLCREHGIRPSFNLMLFDPDCTVVDVVESIDLAAEHLDLPWNVCRTEIYAGTRLEGRLRRQGRLEGDYRSYGYQMADPTAEIMFRILRVSFHEHAFDFDSLLNKLISLSFARQVHEALFPGGESAALSAQVDQLLVETHEDSVKELARTLDFASGSDLSDVGGIQQFAIERALVLNARDLPRHQRFELLWSKLEARGEVLLDEKVRKSLHVEFG